MKEAGSIMGIKIYIADYIPEDKMYMIVDDCRLKTFEDMIENYIKVFNMPKKEPNKVLICEYAYYSCKKDGMKCAGLCGMNNNQTGGK